MIRIKPERASVAQKSARHAPADNIAYLEYRGITDMINSLRAAVPDIDIIRTPQDRQVLRHAWLGDTEIRAQHADIALAVLKPHDDPEPRGIRQRRKTLRNPPDHRLG